jgi:hypothetical protein
MLNNWLNALSDTQKGIGQIFNQNGDLLNFGRVTKGMTLEALAAQCYESKGDWVKPIHFALDIALICGLRYANSIKVYGTKRPAIEADLKQFLRGLCDDTKYKKMTLLSLVHYFDLMIKGAKPVEEPADGWTLTHLYKSFRKYYNVYLKNK